MRSPNIAEQAELYAEVVGRLVTLPAPRAFVMVVGLIDFLDRACEDQLIVRPAAFSIYRWRMRRALREAQKIVE